MDLAQVIAHFPDLRFFDPAKDNEEVLRFSSGSPMRVGDLVLRYDRSPRFQDLLRLQGRLAKTVLAHDARGFLSGVCSISVGRRWVDGKSCSVGYVGDFRIQPGRHMARLWRKSYAEVLRAFRADDSAGAPKYFLTAILKKNLEALRALAGRGKDYGFQYLPLAEVEMVNVYGRFRRRRFKDCQVRSVRPDEETLLREFYLRAEKSKLFGADDWDDRQEHWPRFAASEFLVAQDPQGQWLACTLPWDPGFAKRMIVERAPAYLRLLFAILRKLGWSLPDVGQALKVTYLTHLNFASGADRGRAVQALVHHLFDYPCGAHMVSFADDRGFSKTLKWIQQRVGVCLFAVTVDAASVPPRAEGQEIGFEMALV